MSYQWSDEEENRNNKKKNTQNSYAYDEDFEEENPQKKSIKLPKVEDKKKVQKSAHKGKKTDKKEKSNQQEEYVNDFDEQPVTKKPNLSDSKADKAKKQAKKQRKTVPKRQESANKDSHQSPQLKNKSQIIKNAQYQSKYLYYLKTQFPYNKEQVSKFPADKIGRLNERLKKYISKVNDELTDMINENMRKLKLNQNKPSKSQPRTVEDQIRLLQEQKKSHQIYLQVIERQNEALVDRYGSLKEQQVEIMINQQLLEIRAAIKEANKDIYNLKKQMHDDGNKLIEEKNLPQRMVEIKGSLLAVKREDEKGQQKIEKNNSNFSDLQKKNAEIDSQLSKLYAQCKKNNIKITTTQQDLKLAKTVAELQKKLNNAKSHQNQVRHLNQTKLAIVKRDTQLLKSELIDVQQRHSQVEKQVQFTQESSKALIEQSRTQNLQPHITAHLDFILKNIQQGNVMNKSNRAFSKSGKDPSKTKSNTYGLKKYSSVTNAHVYNRDKTDSQPKASFHIQKKNPLLLTKKDKNLLKISQNKSQQRVWKQGQKQGVKVEDVKVNKVATQSNEKQQVEVPVEKSKPFSVKKSQPKLPKQEIIQPEIPKQKEVVNQIQVKQVQKPSALGPKMMKFKKRGNQEADRLSEVEKENKNDDKPEDNSNLKLQQVENTKVSKPMFKLKKAQKQKVPIPEQQLNVFATQLPQDKKKTTQNLQIKQQNKVEQEGAINFGAKRQVQRKIKRKDQDSYVL